MHGLTELVQLFSIHLPVESSADVGTKQSEFDVTSDSLLAVKS